MSDEIERLLTEIRDVQMEHLAEYRRVTEKMLPLQEQAIKRQQTAVRRGLIVLLILLPCIILSTFILLRYL